MAEKSTFRAFMVVFASGAAAVSVGITLYLTYPDSPLGQIGAFLCFVGVMYWAWEILLLPSGRAEVPGMLRLVFSLLAASVTLMVVVPFLTGSHIPIVKFIPPPAVEVHYPRNTPIPKQIAPSESCELVATLTTDPVARIYARGVDDPSKGGSYAPYLQELFYEWKLVLTPNICVKDVSIVAKTSHLDSDRIKVVPDTASVVRHK